VEGWWWGDPVKTPYYACQSTLHGNRRQVDRQLVPATVFPVVRLASPSSSGRCSGSVFRAEGLDRAVLSQET